MPGTHALLSASAAHRWLHCTGSPRFEQQFGEQETSYASEGTFAHEVAEIKLGQALFKAGYWKQAPGKKLNRKSEFWGPALEDTIDGYVCEVMEQLAGLRDPLVLLEQRLDFSRWVPGGFGTGDVVILSEGVLDIIDLKYGKGVPVQAEENPQLMLYGLGALEAFDYLYDINTVRMQIKQPRLDSSSTYTVSPELLFSWAETEVAPRAREAIQGEGRMEAGEWCRFCRARSVCRARAEANLQLAKFEFAPGPSLRDEEIGEILSQAGELRRWAEDIENYALKEAETGKRWAGWKLVAGRSVRKYKDEKQAAQLLLASGYSEEDIFKKELLGITAMEKVLGKKKFQELLDGEIVKPPGKPTLVPESDKRPEIGGIAYAIQDFKEE